MKKKIIITAILLCFVLHTHAQGLDEWFNQKQTQKKYLLEQIAALKVYLDYTKKGYGIVRDGTGLISDIRKGDFGLHSNRFDSLGKVNPKVRNYGSTGKILDLQAQMAKGREDMQSRARQSGQFSGDELQELKRWCAKLSEASAKDIEELELVINDGKLQLSDDQRIERIEKLYAATRKQYAYQNSLSRNLSGLADMRKRNENDIRVLKELHGLN